MAKRQPVPPGAWSGMILIDKPLGLTSQQVVSRAQRLTGAQRAGHTGTLDPLASGLLPICINEGTKFAGYLLAEDKRYQATLQLGCTTDTGDLEGQILSTCTDPLPSNEVIQKTVPLFVGEQDQIPPRYAAIKHQGKKYYEYAREGIEIERPARRITIFSIVLVNIDLPYITLDIHCSSGTYIRSLAEDIGHALGCGATLSALRRTAVGSWAIDAALSLESLPSLTLQDDKKNTQTPLLQHHSSFIECSAMLEHVPICILSPEEIAALYQGRSLNNRTETEGLYRLFRDMMQSKMFIGLGDIQSQQLVSRRLLANISIT